MFLVLITIVSLSFGGSYYDCVREAIPITRAVNIAKDYVGKPFKVWVSKSKRTGECFWKVKGTEGYITLKAKTGEIIKFYRNRK